jgi:hypothetical protein
MMYNNSVRTSQETRYVSATKTNRLLLFRETVFVHYENDTEHTNTHCVYRNQSFNVLKRAVHIIPTVLQGFNCFR